MEDSYRRLDDRRPTLPSLFSKRSRSDFDVSSGHDFPSYFGRDDERAAHRFIGDSDSVGASYDRYMRSAQISLYGGGGSARPLSGGLSGPPIDDPRRIGILGSNPVVTTKSHSMGLGDGRPLPPDASSTLFVEGLPANCTRREVSYIFRPFVGYKEVRLVTKEPRCSGDDPLVLCFVDFVSPAHAATAKDALQAQQNPTAAISQGSQPSLPPINLGSPSSSGSKPKSSKSKIQIQSNTDKSKSKVKSKAPAVPAQPKTQSKPKSKSKSKAQSKPSSPPAPPKIKSKSKSKLSKDEVLQLVCKIMDQDEAQSTSSENSEDSSEQSQFSEGSTTQPISYGRSEFQDAQDPYA